MNRHTLHCGAAAAIGAMAKKRLAVYLNYVNLTYPNHILWNKSNIPINKSTASSKCSRSLATLLTFRRLPLQPPPLILTSFCLFWISFETHITRFHAPTLRKKETFPAGPIRPLRRRHTSTGAGEAEDQSSAAAPPEGHVTSEKRWLSETINCPALCTLNAKLLRGLKLICSNLTGSESWFKLV